VVSDDGDVLRRTEEWFLSRGIPHFIEDYSASRDVFTRASPLLLLILLVEILGAANKDFPWWGNALALVGGVALILGAWALANRMRHRPALARPETIGPIELAIFVIAPGILPLVFGDQKTSAAVTSLTNAVLLGVIYLGTSYGVVPMTRWAAGRLVHQLESLIGLLVRALPLLLLFVTFLFLTTEVWQVCSTLYGPFFVATLGLFVVVGVVFVVLRLPREIGQLARFDDWEAVRALVVGTPAEELASVGPGDVEAEPLGRRQWGNVGLVVLFGQGLQVLLVSTMIGVFLVLFGLLAVRTSTIAVWITPAVPNVLATVGHLGGRTVEMTEELLRVVGFLTAFSGLYFTVVVLTDSTYRAEFLEEVVGEVRQAFAVRAVYLRARAGTARTRS